MLGVSVFAYAALHLALYGLDQNFHLAHIASEIARRIYLAIGFAAFLILCVLASTSTDAMIKRLGERWGRLHKWVYAMAALGTIHFFMQSKLDVSEALVMGGIFALLMGYRAVMKFNRDPAPWALACLAVAAGIVTALAEAAWYALAKGADFLVVLQSDFDFSFTIRPAWFVLGAGVILLAARLLRPWLGAPARAPREQPSQSRQTVAVSRSLEEARASDQKVGTGFWKNLMRFKRLKVSA
jgi:sulfoxide reductase heme-binding subunit YedZ